MRGAYSAPARIVVQWDNGEIVQPLPLPDGADPVEWLRELMRTLAPERHAATVFVRPAATR